MKNKWRILKILVTVIILGFLLSFSLKRFNNKPLENIAVNMTSSKTPVYFIDEKDVKDLVKKANPTKKIGDISIPDLEKKLKALPAVDSANVYLNLNGKLNLDIRQRIPVFRLNTNGRDFYVDEKGVEFPISKNYSHPCMLVSGDVKKTEYKQLAQLVKKIDADDFSRKYFIGISKENGSYNLLTTDGNYKVEIGDLDNIEFKVKGFKAFVEKFLVYQNPAKYSKVSVRYDNQIVTTLNPNFDENDSILAVGKKEMEKAPVVAKKKALATASQNVAEIKPAPKKAESKPKEKTKEKLKEQTKTAPAKKPAEKPKEKTKPKSPEKPPAKTPTKQTPAKITTAAKPKAKVKIE